MCKLLGIAFCVLLVGAHLADLQGDALQRPLSMFRDGDPAWIGYAMFAALVGVGAGATRTAFRVQCDVQTVVYAGVTVLLAVIAATPSNDPLHSLCTLAALAAMFLNFAVLLYLSDSIFWWLMHMLTPSVMLLAAQFESYGAWQKGMILYFLAATVIHDGLLAQWLPRPRGRRRRTAAGA